MRLATPWALLLLALLPVVVFAHRRAKRSGLRFPLLGTFRSTGTGRRAKLHWLPDALRLVAAALIVAALARPQAEKAESRMHTEGIDIMLAVDVSGSMLAEDFSLNGERANRLAAVKEVVEEFVKERPGDRFGLVLFAARPYTQCPLTLDHGWLLENLDRAKVGMIEDGTAIGSALATAVARLEASDAKSKIVILLTDGRNNVGKISPDTAAEAAKALGYKVYTIGAGTRGVAPYPTRDIFGNKVYQPIRIDIDEETLNRIATVTGGKYFRATDTSSLRKIYAEINEMEKSPAQGLRYLDYDELYPWLAFPALFLLVVEGLLAKGMLRVLP